MLSSGALPKPRASPVCGLLKLCCVDVRHRLSLRRALR
jgi:hypothetical protein